MENYLCLDIPCFHVSYKRWKKYGCVKEEERENIKKALSRASGGYCMYCYSRVETDHKQQGQLEHAIEKSNSDKLVECVPNIGLACSDCNSSLKRRGEAQRNKNMRGEVLKQFEEKSRCSVKRRKQCTVPCKALRKLQESYNKLPGGEIILQPMGAKGEQSGEPLALQYNVLKMEFQPNTNQYTYSKEELSFIQKHIQRFHLNDPQYRTHQLADFLKIIIDGGGMIPQYEYNNLVVKLFADKIREKTKEERVDIYSRIYVVVFLKI